MQDRLPVKFQDVKFTVLKYRHERFVRIEHSYFSIICLQSIFSFVEIIIELFVLCQKLMHTCSYYIKNFKVTNLTLYMYLLHIPMLCI